MIKKLLQILADKTIKLIGKADDEKDLEILFSFGLHLDDFAIRRFKIYLD